MDELSEEFAARVLTYVHLDDNWETMIIKSLKNETTVKDSQQQQDRLTRALENLRKQHLWGDITDEEYRRERANLEHQLKLVAPDFRPANLPNLERAAQLLNDLPTLWSHPGVTNGQRESLIQEVFTNITINGKILTSIEPKPTYAPLFAAILSKQIVEYCDLEPPPSPPETRTSLHKVR